jgi:hypothetical protein
MKKRNMNRNRQTRSNGASALYSKYVLLSAVCGVALVASFFFGAQQHFSSIDYSMQNNKLKKQIEELESAKKGLVLAREVSLSPAEIKKAAKKIGFFDVQNETVAINTTPSTVESIKPAKAVAAKPADSHRLVQKTVQTTAINTPKPKIVEKTEKRDPMTRDRKVLIAGR